MGAQRAQPEPATSRPSHASRRRRTPQRPARPEIELAPLVRGVPENANLVQRACACGGRCPRCAKRASGVHIGAPDDRYEREAERVAQQVVRMPDPPARAQPTRASSATSPRPRLSEVGPGHALQRSAAVGAGGAVSGSRRTDPVLAARGGGRPLSEGERAFFEPRFGADFRDVRLRDDAAADTAARSIGARAYATGRHVVFRAGAYTAGTPSGRLLLAHELAHVVQQRGRHSASGATIVQRVPEPGPPPSDLRCMVSRDMPPANHWVILFDQDSATLRPEARQTLGSIAAAWQTDQGDVRVDGFASEEGAGSLNWHISCRRARSAGVGLIDPPGRERGIPLRHLHIRAQGETDRFGTDLWRNRRVAIWLTNTAERASGGWTVAEIVANVRRCDGGAGLGPVLDTSTVTIHTRSQSNPDSRVIRIKGSLDRCGATQMLVQEASNMSFAPAILALKAAALSGNLSRENWIREIERLEYFGVLRVIRACDQCNEVWGNCPECNKDWARPATDFDDYFDNYLNDAHKERLGQWWDRNARAAWEARHPPARRRTTPPRTDAPVPAGR